MKEALLNVSLYNLLALHLATAACCRCRRLKPTWAADLGNSGFREPRRSCASNQSEVSSRVYRMSASSCNLACEVHYLNTYTKFAA